MSRSRAISHLALVGVIALGVTACGSTTDASTPAAPAAGSSTAAASTAASSTLALASTSLGQVVVDASGRTLYMFGKDTAGSGKSACTGGCVTAWPPVLATGAPTATGVTGTLGTIDTPDGKKQVTLNGWPLYTYAKDAKAGDTTGQGVGQVWYVVDKTGTPVKETGSTTTGY